MSDFDKEAEREKLREKYERDEQERQATQRMSDLLLKGATMTNAHCGTCGDPLFQLDGTTFCPSCHGNPDAVEGTDLEAQSAGESAAEDEGTTVDDADRSVSSDAGERAEQAETGGTTEPNVTSSESQSRRGQRGEATDASDSAASSATDDATAEPVESATGEDPAHSSATDADRARRSTDDRRSAARPRTDASRAGGGRSADGDLEAAHDSLVAALEKFAGKAAATDDPRHATACLEAAREASETLETLR